MKPVKIKQCKYFMQVVKENHLPYLLNEEKEVFDKVYKLIIKNSLYNEVWDIIEKEANRIVKEECEPEWDRISKEMNKLNVEREELQKKIDKVKADWKNVSKKDEEKMNKLNEEISNLSDESADVWVKANAKLNEFKDNLIDGKYKKTSCFDLHDADYKLIDRVIGWSVYDWEIEWNVVVPN